MPYLTVLPTTTVWSLLVEWDWDDDFQSFLSSRQSLHRSNDSARQRLNEVIFEITGGCRPDEIETLEVSERQGSTFLQLAVGLRQEPKLAFGVSIVQLTVEP